MGNPESYTGLALADAGGTLHHGAFPGFAGLKEGVDKGRGHRRTGCQNDEGRKDHQNNEYGRQPKFLAHLQEIPKLSYQGHVIFLQNISK